MSVCACVWVGTLSMSSYHSRHISYPTPLSPPFLPRFVSSESYLPSFVPHYSREPAAARSYWYFLTPYPLGFGRTMHFLHIAFGRRRSG